VSVQVREAVERLGRVVAELEPARLDGVQARQLFEEFARASRLADAGKALAARRVDETGSWADAGGHRSIAHWMAAVSGTTVGAASATVEAAQQLDALPDTEAALRAGELSGVQVNEIAAAATADPSAERDLLRHASVDGLKGLRTECARVRAAAATEEVARYERIRDSRSLRHWEEADGTGRIDIRGPVDATARVMLVVGQYETELFKAARAAGTRERPDALLFDAMVAMADASSGATEPAKGPKATVVVRVDHRAFVTGRTEPGDVCEIAGVGPIPATVAQRLACDSIMKALITDGVDVLAVSHLGRTIPAHLRTALDELYPECTVEGCHVNTNLEIDHNIPVEEQGPTALWNLNKLCPWHHDQKHLHKLRLEGTGTSKRLVPASRPPPDDPDPPPSGRERAPTLALAVAA
jgi:hypothetical protein